MLLAERWIMARLRDRRFGSLGEANAAIGELVAWVNNRPFRRLGDSRRELFESLDRRMAVFGGVSTIGGPSSRTPLFA